jgi:hypothetical protein
MVSTCKVDAASMPAISLGVEEVEERLRQIRDRLNSGALQHVAYLSGTVIVLLGAMLVIVALRAPPNVWHSYLVAYAVVACAIAGVSTYRLRSQWLSLESVARIADRQAALDSRLSTLHARRSHPQRSRLGGILLAQTLALGPRWDRTVLAPRRVPRSVYLLLTSLVVFAASWLVPPAEVESSVAQNDGSATAPEHERIAVINRESLGSSTSPMRASRESGIAGDSKRAEAASPKGGSSGSVDQRSELGGLDHSPDSGDQTEAVAGSPGDEAVPRQPSQNGTLEDDKHNAKAQRAPASGAEPEGAAPDRRPSAQAKSATKEATTLPDQRAKQDPDPSEKKADAKARSDTQTKSAAAMTGAKPSGETGGRTNDSLFEDGESPPAAPRGEDGKPGTFALQLSGTSASTPADLEPQNKKPRDGVPAFGMGQTSAAQTELAEQPFEDDPLQKAHISPEHESLLQRIFRHD